MMGKVKSEAVDRVLAEATNFESDRISRALQGEKTWKRVAFGALAVAAISALSNVFLFPLKETVPEIIRVDSVTGVVDVQRCTDCSTSYNELTDKYWLRLYVRTREGFTFPEYDSIYRTLGLLSSPEETGKFYEFYKPENPNSPVATMGDRIKVKTSVRSVAFPDKGLASVRFKKTTEQSGARPIETYWIATIKYRYVDAPAAEGDREVNPLGFQVTDYRIDPETDVEVAR